MIDNLTDKARQYAQARAAARVARNSPLNALFVDAHHERAHQLATEADGLAARQIMAIAAAFARNTRLSCPLAAVLDAELIPQGAAEAAAPCASVTPACASPAPQSRRTSISGHRALRPRNRI